MERDYRKDFPLLMQDRTVYLDNAATAQRPQCVIDAEMDFYKNHNANPLRGTYPLSVEATDIYEQARAGRAVYPCGIHGGSDLYQKHDRRHQSGRVQLWTHQSESGR